MHWTVGALILCVVFGFAGLSMAASAFSQDADAKRYELTRGHGWFGLVIGVLAVLGLILICSGWNSGWIQR